MKQSCPPLASTLIEHGLPAVEITFRTKAASEAIARIKDAYPKVVCCAGIWMVAAKLNNEENWNEIGSLVRQAVELVKQIQTTSR